MELSMQLNYLTKSRFNEETRSFEDAVRLCAGAGFRYVDYTPDFKADDWREKALRDRDVMAAAGIAVEQTHVPYNRYRSYDPEDFKRYYQRVFEMSALLGAKYVVVHADEYCVTDHYDQEEIERFEYDYLAPYVDYAAKHGLVVALENLFEDHVPFIGTVDGKSRFMSRVEEVASLIERFNTPTVGCCWDFGHAHVAFGKEQLEAMKRVVRYIRCTHVHDNYYGRDLHLVPFQGEVDWEGHMACLKENGYAGKLSFEFAYGFFPSALMPMWVSAIHQVGEYLAGLFDGAAANG